MLMMSGVYEQDSNVTQLGNFKLETIHYSGKKWKHKLSKMTCQTPVKSNLKSLKS